MLNRLKRLLVESFIGAIALGYATPIYVSVAVSAACRAPDAQRYPKHRRHLSALFRTVLSSPRHPLKQNATTNNFPLVAGASGV
jgi:hypothetical protein